jgi:heterodisulfide reductase subunit C
MPRFVVRRRFSSWIGECWDMLDTEEDVVLAVVTTGGEARAQALVDEANALHAKRKEVALTE